MITKECQHTLPPGFSGQLTITAPAYSCVFCEIDRLQLALAESKTLAVSLSAAREHAVAELAARDVEVARLRARDQVLVAAYAALEGYSEGDPGEVLTKLIAENTGLRQAVDAASGPHCSWCGNSIDLDTCHCGVATSDPGHDNHSPVPMGCVCGFVEPDWQALAMTRGEQMHRLRVENAKLRAARDRRGRDMLSIQREIREAAGILDGLSPWMAKLVLDLAFVEGPDIDAALATEKEQV